MNVPRFAEHILRWVMNLHIILYRLLRGRLPGNFLGRDTILVTTVGRRTGRLRTTPLLFVRDGDDFFVVASYGGSHTHPAWYRNIEANPHVLVEAHGQTVETCASLVDESEYEALWARFVAIYGGYTTYRRRTTRVLPIVRLRPAPAQVVDETQGSGGAAL